MPTKEPFNEKIYIWRPENPEKDEAVPDYLFESDNPFEIPNLLIERQAGKLQLPLWGYGSLRRDSNANTVHFYVDDYRFENIWKKPDKLLWCNIKAVMEPNTSLFDTTPVAYGLTQIYKKRWISRFLQENGILVYADLNVSSKFYELNLLGVPYGYNAFSTRGYADRLQYLQEELKIARSISGKITPNLIVYGGGEHVRRFCYENSILYVHDLMTKKHG